MMYIACLCQNLVSTQPTFQISYLHMHLSLVILTIVYMNIWSSIITVGPNNHTLSCMP